MPPPCKDTSTCISSQCRQWLGTTGATSFCSVWVSSSGPPTNTAWGIAARRPVRCVRHAPATYGIARSSPCAPNADRGIRGHRNRRRSVCLPFDRYETHWGRCIWSRLDSLTDTTRIIDSPALIFCPAISVSAVAVRIKCRTGDTQRIISSMAVGIRPSTS